MERKLASLQKIVATGPIKDADRIEMIQVLGWYLVVKKDEFKVGDLCVYFEVDSMLPIREEFEFLRKSSYNGRLDAFRVKTMKMRGQISQGIAMPLSILGDESDLEEGDDVTDILGVTKYEMPISPQLQGQVKGSFPSFIPKTDEIRIQSVPDVLGRHLETRMVITEKLDGTSATFFYDHIGDEFGVCSRNLQLKETEENTYWKMARSLDLENKIKNVFPNQSIAIQGEIVGPGIQQNKYKLTEHKFFMYHGIDIERWEYLSHRGFVYMAQLLELETVPIIDVDFHLNGFSIDHLVVQASGSSMLYNIAREGIVIKAANEETDHEIGRLSFKVINPEFLLKHEKNEE